METNTKSKNFLIAIVVIIILLFIANYFYGQTLFNKIFSEKPYMVETPESYPTGTTVSLYENVPTDFPQNIILEGKKLDYSGVVKSSDNKKQITVVYSSNTQILKLLGMYTDILTKNNWKIINSKISQQNIATIQASSDTGSLIITFVPSTKVKTDTVLTFQYQLK